MMVWSGYNIRRLMSISTFILAYFILWPQTLGNMICSGSGTGIYIHGNDGIPWYLERTERDLPTKLLAQICGSVTSHIAANKASLAKTCLYICCYDRFYLLWLLLNNQSFISTEMRDAKCLLTDWCSSSSLSLIEFISLKVTLDQLKLILLFSLPSSFAPDQSKQIASTYQRFVSIYGNRMKSVS